jgi:rhomboid protease GluP
MWDALPYYLRTGWASRVDGATTPQIARYLQREASPAALELALANPDLDESLHDIAQARLTALNIDSATRQRISRHFKRLLVRSRSKLLQHLSVADRANAEVDRLDLLAEIVALRDAQADVQTERNLARTFRGMFATRDPFVVWVLVCVCFAIFILLAKSDPADSREVIDALRLEPNLTRPWTLLTHGLLHRIDDWRHIILNMVALILVGQVLEQFMGHIRFLAAFFACMVGGGLLSVLVRIVFDIPFATVGASGAISGLAGMTLFLGLWFQGRYGRIPLRYATPTLIGGVILVSNVLLSATSLDAGVDHGAHVGGLICGIGLGAWLRPKLGERAATHFARTPIRPNR